jgi:hypothetical protein
MAPDALHSAGWSPDAWRVVCDRGRIGLHDIDALRHAVRPPRSDETSELRWLAHGSSITHASFSSHTGFAARMLHADVQNKGLGGSCHIEPEPADCLAYLEWDLPLSDSGSICRTFSPQNPFLQNGFATWSEASASPMPLCPSFSSL